MRISRRSFAVAPALAPLLAQNARPWLLLVAERHGAHLGKVGTPGLCTPRLDALAEQGTYFTRCYANAPLALPAEASYRAQQPRESYQAVLDLLAKKPASLVVTLPAGLTFANARPPVNAADVRVPACWPNLAAARAAWVAYLSTVQCLDALVGAVLDALQRSGRAEETQVLYTAQAGPQDWRRRDSLYHLTLHVPLLARGPEMAKNSRRHELVSLASLPAATPVPIIKAANERTRSVLDERFHYLRNLQPGAAELPPGEWREASGKYPLHWRLMTAPVPAEELYDLDSDPFEMQNLAADLQYSAERIRLAELA